jgi:hypothetical protein
MWGTATACALGNSKHAEIMRRLEFSASLAQTQIIPLFELITSTITHRPTIRARTVNTREETQERLGYTSARIPIIMVIVSARPVPSIRGR